MQILSMLVYHLFVHLFANLSLLCFHVLQSHISFDYFKCIGICEHYFELNQINQAVKLLEIACERKEYIAKHKLNNFEYLFDVILQITNNLEFKKFVIRFLWNKRQDWGMLQKNAHIIQNILTVNDTLTYV